MVADLILRNLRAVTFAPECAAPELIAIKGNKIIYAGTNEALGQMKGPHTRELDCAGGIVIPGFNDAHCHPLAFAITLRYVDCSPAQVSCIADIQAALRDKAGGVPRGQWVRGANYDAAALAEKRPPNRWELDQAVPHLPVVLVERSGQQCVLNSSALERCGISERVAESGASKLGRYPATGKLDGVVSGNNELVAKAIPPLSEQEIDAGLRLASAEYLSHGITSVQDTSWSNGYRHWAAMKGFKDRGVLAPRLTLFAGFDAVEEFVLRGLKTGSGDDQMRLGAAKIALDESTGNPRPSQEDLNRAALEAHLAGFQLAFHVSDVYALETSMRALEFIRKCSPVEPIRPRFEHCPVCPPALLPALAKSGAIVVAQPNLLYTTGPHYLQEVTQEQLKWVFPFRSFLEHGISLAFSSDSPLTPCDPLRAIHTAVTRMVEGGAMLSIDESISVADALRMYTYAGAYASLEERTKGRIAVGKLADLAVLSGDPRQMTAEEPFDGKVVVTLIDGKVAWES